MPTSSTITGARIASELMRRHMMALSPDDTLSAAFQMIRLSRVRQLPVVEGEKILGEVSHLDTFLAYRDILEAGAKLDPAAVEDAIGEVNARSVQTIMRPVAHFVSPDATVEQIVRSLRERRAGFVPVVVETGDGGLRIKGIVTETDLLAAALGPPLLAFARDPVDADQQVRLSEQTERDAGIIHDGQATNLVGDDETRRLAQRRLGRDRDRVARHDFGHVDRAHEAAPMIGLELESSGERGRQQIALGHDAHQLVVLDHGHVPDTTELHHVVNEVQVVAGIDRDELRLHHGRDRLFGEFHLAPPPLLGLARMMPTEQHPGSTPGAEPAGACHADLRR